MRPRPAGHGIERRWCVAMLVTLTYFSAARRLLRLHKCALASLAESMHFQMPSSMPFSRSADKSKSSRRREVWPAAPGFTSAQYTAISWEHSLRSFGRRRTSCRGSPRHTHACLKHLLGGGDGSGLQLLCALYTCMTAHGPAHSCARKGGRTKRSPSSWKPQNPTCACMMVRCSSSLRQSADSCAVCCRRHSCTRPSPAHMEQAVWVSALSHQAVQHVLTHAQSNFLATEVVP
jgi:hypothetical protein